MALKHVLITGCSAGGIGSALVESFQRRGLHVFATAPYVTKMAHLQSLPNVTVLPLDPTSETSVSASVESVKAVTGGKLDYVVNNTAQTIIIPTLDFDVETAREMYEINVWGLMRVTQAFAPLVIEAEGTFMNIASISTAVHTPWMGVYAGSKAAMTQITDTLRMELAPFNVKVVTVMTGTISTNILASDKNFQLPSTSRYRSIEKEIAARARGEDGTPRMTPAAYVEKVVEDFLGGVNQQIWRGGYASIVRFTSSWFPAALSDRISLKGTGLDVMPKQN